MYEGKELIMYLSGEPIVGIVVACDPDVGISVVAKDDPEKFLMCINCSLSPRFHGGNKPEQEGKVMRNIVLWVMSLIENGNTLDGEEYGIVRNQLYDTYYPDKYTLSAGSAPSTETCAFSL